MPVVRNKSGLEKVFVDNLEELGNLSARTDIADTSTSVFLKASASGVLEVNSSSSLKANDGNDGAGTDRTVKCDGNGILQVKEIGTVNIAPANSVNSHITDDPANSVCVGLKARQTIGTATSETFLLCDSSGNLHVNVNNKQDILSFIPSPHWVSGAFSDIFDVSNASKIRIYGNVQTTDTLQIQYASSVVGGVYDWIFATQTIPITTIDGSICIDFVIDCPPPYIRFKNNSASNQTASLRIVKH